MKKTIIALAVMLSLSSLANAMTGTTKEGYPLCFQKEWLEELMQFEYAKDRASYDEYMRTDKCLIMRKAISVTVLESPGVFGTTTGIVIKGTKAWTLREGVVNYR